MNIHKNARLTPHGRELLVRQIASGQTPEAAARAAGVCPRTARKWHARYSAEGVEGLKDRSSRPHRLREPTPTAIVEQVEALRRQRWTGKQIAAELNISPATVSRILKRLGLNRIAALEPAEPVRRYERDHPGELIHIDIKKLGRFERVGHRITGSPQQGKSRGAGWEFVHVCIDDASRIAFSQILPDEKKGSAVAFLTAAVAYYASLGVTLARVMTDNGSATARRPSATFVTASALGTSGPGPTPQGPTARPNASSRPRSASGPTPQPSKPHSSAAPNSPIGSIATTGIAHMLASTKSRPSAASA